MIAKHVPMRSIKKSDFAELVKYITDEQGKTERLGHVRVTNCEAETLPAVIGEVLATQHANTRAESDKTFHLLVSFPPGENPGADVLRAIEDRICAGLGFGEHQRVSAVHHDTDHLHLHIAINKIHPTRGTIHEPYQSYRTLAALCTILEREYGLQEVNHVSRKNLAEGRAADMERHAGVESLVGWIKRECLPDLQAAQSWDDLHRVLRENGLELRERGNGFIFEAGDGTTVKASTVSRDLSKPKLEARFGAFTPAEGSEVPRRREYRPKPLKTRIDTTELYARYQSERQEMGGVRKGKLDTLRLRRDRLIEAAKRSNRLRRAAIKLLGEGRVAKRLMYAQAHKALRADLDKINRDYRRDRQAVQVRTQRRAWADWLRAEAMKGDDKALAALRAREGRSGLKGNTIQGRGEAKPGHAAVTDNITKKGTIIYRVGSSAVRDDGDRLQVSREATTDGLDAALRLAMERFGDRITVNGTAEFKERIAQAAAAGRLAITFDDAALEQRRQELLTKEQAHEQPERNDGRRDRGGDGGIRPTAAGTALNAAGGDGDRRDARAVSAGGTVAVRKPNVGRIGRKPPPQSQNRLRALSQLGVVRIAGGAEMLLPRDVPGHMEQQGAEPAHPLRRGVFGSGRGLKLKPEQVAAVEKYVAEREQKRLKGFDIPKHTRYNDYVGALSYAGTRNVEDQTLALLRKENDEILVLPVDKATVQRMKRLAIGDPVIVTPRGSLRTTQGRSR